MAESQNNEEGALKENNNQNVAQTSALNESNSVSIYIDTKNVDTKNVEETRIPENLNQLKETIIDMPLSKAENSLRSNCRENVLEYKYRRKTPTTWVYFQSNMMVPSDGPPLSYDPGSRNIFVLIVLILTTIMLSSTAIIVMTISLTPLKAIFIKFTILFLVIGAVFYLTALYVLYCSPCGRRLPCNVICLFLTVISWSILCSYFTFRYKTHIIFLALLATTVAVFICTLLACSSFDFTSWILYIVMISAGVGTMMMLMLLAKLILGLYFKPLHIALLIISVIASCFTLITELQMVLGGRTVELSEDDYAMGAFLLYTSIIDLFLKLLQLFGLISDD